MDAALNSNNRDELQNLPMDLCQVSVSGPSTGGTQDISFLSFLSVLLKSRVSQLVYLVLVFENRLTRCLYVLF